MRGPRASLCNGHRVRRLFSHDLRRTDILERDCGRSLREALKRKNLRSGHADKMMRVRVADKHAVYKRQRCVVKLRLPTISRRRI